MADSTTFPKLTDLPVIRCIFKVLITVTMIPIFNFMKSYMVNQIPQTKAIANGPECLDKHVIKIFRRYHVVYEEVSSKDVVGVSVRAFLGI